MARATHTLFRLLMVHLANITWRFFEIYFHFEWILTYTIILPYRPKNVFFDTLVKNTLTLDTKRWHYILFVHAILWMNGVSFGWHQYLPFVCSTCSLTTKITRILLQEIDIKNVWSHCKRFPQSKKFLKPALLTVTSLQLIFPDFFFLSHCYSREKLWNIPRIEQLKAVEMARFDWPAKNKYIPLLV